MFRNTVPGKVHVMPLYVLDGVSSGGPSEFSKAASAAYGAMPQAQKDNFKSAERLEILARGKENIFTYPENVVLVWVSLLIMGLSGSCYSTYRGTSVE